MTNTFLNQLKHDTNFKFTENGGIAHSSTLDKNLDMFAFGGAYRSRSDMDVILLFKSAYEEDKVLAMKNLFYIRDVIGGQGERRFFRVAYRWLCDKHPDAARANLIHIPEFGRWDDLIYIAERTSLQIDMLRIIKHQLALDIESETPSLLAKWLPSQNASSAETKRLGLIIAHYLGMTSKQYRQTLTELRKRINVLETLMSQGRWDEIKFDKIPSKAGIKYKNAFARHDIIKQKYEAFMKDESTTVNAKALYPYDIAHMIFDSDAWYDRPKLTEVERNAIQKYWDNLPDFYKGREENAIAVVDVSGSMYGRPIEGAVSLGAYIAEKGKGPFANHFITFSKQPKLVEFEGVDITDKFCRCADSEWGANTDIEAVFDLLYNTIKTYGVKPEDVVKRLYILTDMEFDAACGGPYLRDNTLTDLEAIKKKWIAEGYEFPKIIFWNLDARNNTIPMIGDGISYVSGLSPVIIDTVLSGKEGRELMIEKLMSERYSKIK